MLLDGQHPDAIAQAAQVLARGELLGLPTETVYGLAADAGNDEAVRKIFAAKGRPSEHPLIVHVVGADDVPLFAQSVPAFAARLMQAFWPGPLTLILPRRPEIAAVAAGGQASVGLRCPSHPLAQAVLRAAQTLGVRGVAAPSANLFGRVSPTTAAHVQHEFGDTLCVLDGGACPVGIESTIVDCTRGAPVLLRPGMITPAQLSQACGLPVVTPGQASDAPLSGEAPRASGTLASHYAPRAQVRLMSLAQIEAALTAQPPLPSESPTLAIWSAALSVPLPVGTVWQALPADAERCAHELFWRLRAFDTQGVRQIWVQAPPPGAAWDGVRDRLVRAATPSR
jgi:L-threonylcarbamoyladenylate synthase